MTLVDLSHPFDPRLAGVTSDDLEIRRVRTVKRDGVNTLSITFNNHIGTHIDVPLHLIPNGSSVDQVPIERFHGTCVILDIPKGPNEGVSTSDLEAARPHIEREDIALICTGWDQAYGTPAYSMDHPYLEAGAAEWLVSRGLRIVGMDVQSVDLPHSLRSPDFSYTSLRVLLRSGVPALHNLANLRMVVGQRVVLSALPVNFVGADGVPARVVAVVE